MLSAVSIWLAEKGYITAVLARDIKKLEKLKDRNSNIRSIQSDYTDRKQFRQIIAEYVINNGKFDIVIAWVHVGQKEVLDIIRTENDNHPFELYHILSNTQNPEQVKKLIMPDSGIKYHQVQLGYKVENKVPRWLSHQEISIGVIESLKNKCDVTIGYTTPT